MKLMMLFIIVNGDVIEDNICRIFKVLMEFDLNFVK